MADPATFIASVSVLGTRTVCLFSNREKIYFRVCIHVYKYQSSEPEFLLQNKMSCDVDILGFSAFHHASPKY